jgi:hemoglobin
VLSDFYSRVLDSEITSPYFDNIDMARLMDHQTKFIASVMGGPASFSDEHLQRVHAHLKIDEAAFSEIATLLRETLEDHDYDETDVGLVVREVVARRALIVS